MRQLNWCLAAQGKTREARELALQMLQHRRTTADLPDASAYMFNSFAKDLLNVEPPDLRDPSLALDYALKARDASTDEYHYNRFTIADAYRQLGDFELALEFVQNALANTQLEDTIERRSYEDLYAEAQEALGNPAAALAACAELIELRQDQFGPDHPDVATAMERYGAALIRHEQLDKAEFYLREALNIRSRSMPDADGCIGCNMSLLGDALALQGRFDDAKQYLVGGYERMREDADGSWIDLHAALQRLVKYGQVVGLADSVERPPSKARRPSCASPSQERACRSPCGRRFSHRRFPSRLR
jgi:tetratricopeptide (TPR) repeat protein